jgi:arylsulfatase A
VHHSINGSFAIREASWKLCLCPESGGWSEPRPAAKKRPGDETARLPARQLYDLATDLGETRNLAGEKPETVERLESALQEIVERGRSTPGAAQNNDVVVGWSR